MKTRLFIILAAAMVSISLAFSTIEGRTNSEPPTSKAAGQTTDSGTAGGLEIDDL